MNREKYLGAIHDAGDGTLFVVLEVGPTRELRGRRTADGIRIETWTRTESVEVGAESLSRLHILAERRPPATSEGE